MSHDHQPIKDEATGMKYSTMVGRAIKRVESRLGKVPDRQLGDEIGVAHMTIALYRRRLGIKACRIRRGGPMGGSEAAI